MKKRYFYLVVSFMAILGMVFYSSNVEAKSFNEYVYDYAELLSEDEEEQLRERAKQIAESDFAMTFLTITDAGGKTSEAYADYFYDTYVGQPDGVLFLIDMDNREVYISTEGLCADWLQEEVDSILNEASGYAGSEAYYDCFDVASERVAAEIDVSFDPLEDIPIYILIVFGLAGIFTLVVILVMLLMHWFANVPTSGGEYMGGSFKVKQKDVVHIGTKQEVIHGYYKQKNNSGGSHGSHGGGGRKF